MGYKVGTRPRLSWCATRHLSTAASSAWAPQPIRIATVKALAYDLSSRPVLSSFSRAEQIVSLDGTGAS